MQSIGSMIDKASSALGGGAKTEAPPAKPVFRRGEPIGDPENPTGGSVGPNVGDSPPNALDTPPPVEFIHYGRVHTDNGRVFPHPKYDPGDRPPPGRAIMFRDALEREAVLLHGFVTSCKGVLKEYQDNRGPLGAVGAAVDMLMGSGSTEPSPDDLDKFDQKATQAGATIKGVQIEYPVIHKAGMDMHQARADFAAFAEKLKAQYVGAGATGPGAQLTSLPGPVKATMTVQKIIFKVFDIYLAMYLEARAEFEDGIEEASYQMTLKAIREKQSPTFPVWFAKEPPAGGGGGGGGGADNPIEEAIDQAKGAVDKARKSVTDFLTVEDGEPAPGDQQLEAAFAVFTSAAPLPSQPGKIRRKAPDVISSAFAGVLGLGDLPGFLTKAIKEITSASLEMLKVVFTKIMKNGAKDAISDEFLMAAGREYLFDKIFNLFFDLVPFLNNLPSANVQGMTLGKDLVKDKAASFLNDEFGRHAEFILKVAMGQLKDKLDEAQKAAKSDDALTMEVFLGRLPYLLSLMVRNTLFPVWDIIVDKVFGSLAGPLGGAMSPVKSIIGDAKGVADKAKGIKDKAEKAKDQLAQGVNQDNVGDFIGGLTGAAPGTDASGGPSGAGFPGSKREKSGQGQSVTKAQIDKVKNEQKVDVAG